MISQKQISIDALGRSVATSAAMERWMDIREKVLSFGTFRFYPSRQQLFDGDQPLRVGSRALGLLQLLIENAGEVVPKKRLIETVWTGLCVDEANLRANIGTLRKVLGDGRDGRRYIQNVTGRGYRFVTPVQGRTNGLSENSPSHDAAPETDRLIGRAQDAESVSEELTANRVVSVVGPGGIGKTSLAMAVADIWRRADAGDITFIDLTTANDAEQLWTAAARAFDVDSTPGGRIQILRAASGRAGLVILDNCEHLLEASADFAAAVLKSGKGIRILTTSRQPLRVHGEWVHRLSPLEYPESDAEVTARQSLAFSAVQLLVERIAEAVGGFTLTDREAAFAVEICRRLGGVPLALELAASRAEAFSLKQLADGLRDRFTLLSGGNRSAVPRHQSLRAMLEWSCQLLTESERALLRRLSVFPAWFDMPEAVAFGRRIGLPEPAVLDGVASLIAKSILSAEVNDDRARYRFAETTRAFAKEMLAGANEITTAYQALISHVTAQYAAELAKEDGPKFGWLACCIRNSDNARACLDWALAEGNDVGAGVELILNALPLWMRTSRLIEHRHYLRPALAHILDVRPKRTKDELALEVALALAQYYSGGPTNEVINRLKRSLVLARRLESKTHELNILWMLYGVSGNWGNYRAEAEFAKEFAEASIKVSAPHAKTRRHRMLARAYHDVGEQRKALREIDRALTLRLGGNADVDAYSIDDVTAALAIKSRILWVTGKAEDAMSVSEECLARALAVDHAQSTCWAIAFNLCPVAIWSGDSENANRFAAVAMAHSEKTFEHWNDWAHLYTSALDPRIDAAAARHLLARMIPAQKDIFATLWPVFAGEDIRSRAVHHTSWCSAELMRLASACLDDAVGMRLLQQADLLAEQQDALGWRLRIASNLAKRHLARGDHTKARAALGPVYESFKQGFKTKDLRDAAELLGKL
jgi:predicted ATPase/DNA-binding winged helix-turn-helix (wHTH) protein